MTITLPTSADRAAVLRAIDAQVRLDKEDDAIVRQARDAQEAVQKLLERRADIKVDWRQG